MMSHDAEFAPFTPDDRRARTPDQARVDTLTELMGKRNEFRELLSVRARVASRDIDAWVAEQVQQIMDDPRHVISMTPPRSLFDVESPF